MRRLSACVAVSLALVPMASAQNILNNGGFETGLMCYLASIWSTTGQFGPGDYRLKLSTDAHSGSYSLEIGCSGSDCFKAAAISNKIPTVPDQDYRFQFWAKCPAGATATIFIPDGASGDAYQYLPCNGTWVQSTMAFRTSSTAKDFFFYLFSYYGDWVRFDDVVLTYGDGTAPAPAPLHAGVRNVSASSQALQVDGAPFLPLGFFDVAHSDLAQVKALGANTVFALGIQPNAACYNTVQKGYLDIAYELGLNFVPDSSSTMRLGVPAVMAAAAQQFAPHLANIAWLLADEPDQSFVPFWYTDPALFVAGANAAKTKTTLPVFADFQRAAWSVASDIAPYAPPVDLFMAEPYGAELMYLKNATDNFKSLPPARPMWLAQDDPDPSVIVPKAYYAVANGVTGIAYFTWDQFKAQPAKLAAAQQVFDELGQLKNVIFSQPIDALVASSAGIAVAARYLNGSAYLLSSNPVPQTANATFQMAGLVAGKQIQVMFENRTLTAASGSFTDSFAGISRHVYVIKAPLTALGGSLLSKTGADSARTWRVQVTNTGLGMLAAAKITSASFTVTGGKACTPMLVSSLPLSVGTIAPGTSAAVDLVVNFTGCDTTSKFTVNIGLSATGASGSIVRNNERK